MSRPPQVSHYRFPVAVAVAVAVALLAGCGDAVVDDLNDTSLGPARPAARTTIAFGISDGYTEPKACIIAAGGRVKCFGIELLGDGSPVGEYRSAYVSGLAGVVEVAVGYAHACALKNDGTVWCWGIWPDAIGDGTQQARPLPVQVVGVTDAVNISVGVVHTCAVRRDSTVACWGSYAYDDRNIAELDHRDATATPVPGVAGVVQTASGSDFTCFRRKHGDVACRGKNFFGELGFNSPPYTLTPLRIPGVSALVDLASHEYRSCGATADGRVACWGLRTYAYTDYSGVHEDPVCGPATFVPGASDAVQVSVSRTDTYVRRGDGTVGRWNGEYADAPDGASLTFLGTVPGLADVVEVRAGYFRGCARLSDESVWCWGSGPPISAVHNPGEPVAAIPIRIDL